MVLMFGIAFYATINLKERNDLCHTKGGMLVDTPAGKACIKAERIQL
jgi:hypothetical protein